MLRCWRGSRGGFLIITILFQRGGDGARAGTRRKRERASLFAHLAKLKLGTVGNEGGEGGVEVGLVEGVRTHTPPPPQSKSRGAERGSS